MPIGFIGRPPQLGGIVILQLILLLVFFDFWSSYFERDSIAAVPGNSWLFGALIAAGYIRYTLRVVPGLKVRVLDVSAVKLWALPLALLSGVLAEVAFRAALMDATAAAGLAIGWQILFSALAYSALHLSWRRISSDSRALLPASIATAVLGACLALLYLTAGRNVWPCVVAHVVISLVIEPWLWLRPLAKPTEK